MSKYIIGYILIVIFYIFMFYLSGIIGVLETTISIILYSIFFYLLHNIWGKIRKKEIMNFLEYLNIFLYRISIMIFVIFGIIFSFSYYNNEINPAKMPTFTISNGEKEVVFQAMSHIAKPSFYEKVRNNIKNYKLNGGVLFFEGVKQGKKESGEKFDKALGVNFTPDLYKNMSKLYGATFQDNMTLLGIVNNKDFNIDLNLDQIIEIYEKKVTNKIKPTKQNNEVVNVSDEIVKKLSELTGNELKVLVYINQSILNVIIRNEDQARKIIEKSGNIDLFSVILDDRNKNLADNILKSEYKKIFVTYGLLHFNGVFELLKKQDPNWKIIKIEYLYPLSSKTN